MRVECPFLAVRARTERSLMLRPCLPSAVEMTASMTAELFAASYYTSETGDPVKMSTNTTIGIQGRRPPTEET